MRIMGIIIAFAVLAATPARGETCYECLAKACYDDFSIKASGINEELDEELADVEEQLAEMQLAAAQKAEVREATEAVLRGNADRRKERAFSGFARCVAAQ
jgi:Skp family chaperone for outer membrane proteins